MMLPNRASDPGPFRRPRWTPGDFLTLATYVDRNERRLGSILDTARRALGCGFGDLLATAAHRTARPKVASAVYESIRCSTEILYDWEEPNPGEGEQLIRLAGEVLQRGVGTCLDLALCYAAAAELTHLAPAVVILETGDAWHAVSGFFTEDVEQSAVVEDGETIRAMINSGHLVLLESAGFAIRRGEKRDFSEACREARGLLEQTKVVALVDVLAAREHGCLPMTPQPVCDATESGSVEIDLHVEPALVHLAPTSPTRSVGVRPRRRTLCIGEEVRFLVWVSADCRLSLVNIGSSGNISIVAPNAHLGNMQVRAGKWRAFPDWNHNFAFPLLGPAGTEKVIALASKMPLKLEPKHFDHWGQFTEDAAHDLRDLVLGRTEIEFYVSERG